MNNVEAARLLAFITAIDNRTPSEAAIPVWADLLNDVSFYDAMDAVKEHTRTQPGVFLEPGHVLRLVRAARARRIEEAGPIPAPPADGPYANTLRVLVKQAADGMALPKAISSGSPDGGVAGDVLRTRLQVRLARYAKPCTWPPCRAQVGQPCMSPTGRVLREPHPSRVDTP